LQPFFNPLDAFRVGSQLRSGHEGRRVTLAPSHDLPWKGIRGRVGAKASRFDGLNVLFPVASLALLVGIAFSLSGAAPAVGVSGFSLRSASLTAQARPLHGLWFFVALFFWFRLSLNDGRGE
jgi:hypothetical protein